MFHTDTQPIEIVSLERQLRELVGTSARVWHFTASHDRLEVKLVNTSKTLQFIFCDRVSTPTLWKLVNPRLSETLSDNPMIVFMDDGVEIICVEVVLEDIEMGESVLLSAMPAKRRHRD